MLLLSEVVFNKEQFQLETLTINNLPLQLVDNSNKVQQQHFNYLLQVLSFQFLMPKVQRKR